MGATAIVLAAMLLVQSLELAGGVVFVVNMIIITVVTLAMLSMLLTFIATLRKPETEFGPDRLSLWAGLFLLTNRQSYLVNNRILGKRTTEMLIEDARERWMTGKSQPISSGGGQSDGSAIPHQHSA